jgi:holo-[acyl-carrier protein] synthase
MKILGIGVDIVENIRIHKSLKNINFIKRVFSSSEILLAKNITNKKSYYSKRFAAKEAFVKALGTGFRKNINFKDISVSNDKLGKPNISINKKVIKILKDKFAVKKYDIYLSLSDEKQHSIAFVIISIN